MREFAIAELALGRGLIGISPIPGRTGPYSVDFQRLLDWRPDLVLSLTTTAEMTGQGADGLGADLAARDIGWRHFPVPDFGVPQQDDSIRWDQAARAAHEALGRGGRVLVHCFGGCGRSGMAILRLMVETGEDADKALARLRAVRPCAVESGEQRRWASGKG